MRYSFLFVATAASSICTSTSSLGQTAAQKQYAEYKRLSEATSRAFSISPSSASARSYSSPSSSPSSSSSSSSAYQWSRSTWTPQQTEAAAPPTPAELAARKELQEKREREYAALYKKWKDQIAQYQSAQIASQVERYENYERIGKPYFDAGMDAMDAFLAGDHHYEPKTPGAPAPEAEVSANLQTIMGIFDRFAVPPADATARDYIALLSRYPFQSVRQLQLAEGLHARYPADRALLDSAIAAWSMRIVGTVYGFNDWAQVTPVEYKDTALSIWSRVAARSPKVWAAAIREYGGGPKTAFPALFEKVRYTAGNMPAAQAIKALFVLPVSDEKVFHDKDWPYGGTQTSMRALGEALQWNRDAVRGFLSDEDWKALAKKFLPCFYDKDCTAVGYVGDDEAKNFPQSEAAQVKALKKILRGLVERDETVSKEKRKWMVALVD